MTQLKSITLTMFILVAVLSGCRKEKLETAGNNKSKLGPGDGYYSYTSQLTENEINESLRATARGVARWAFENQSLAALTRQMIAVKFDGDYNVLFKDLASEAGNQFSIDLYDETISSTDENISGTFLHSFNFTSNSNESFTLMPQIYSPDADYFEEDIDLSSVDYLRSNPIVVWCPYFVDEEDEDDFYEGFQWDGSTWQTIMVNEEMLSTNSVWVISINDRNVKGTQERNLGNIIEYPGRPGCEISYSVILTELKLNEMKERWVEGGPEPYVSTVWLEEGAYRLASGSRQSGEPWLGSIIQGRELSARYTRKEVKDGDIKYPNDIIHHDWVVECSDNGGFRFVIFEYDWHGVLKSFVPHGAQIYDFNDEDGDIKVNGTTYTDYPDGEISADYDYDINNNNRFQVELDVFTAYYSNKKNRSMTIPYLYGDIPVNTAWFPNVILNYTFASGNWVGPSSWANNSQGPAFPDILYGPERFSVSQRPPNINDIYLLVHSGATAKIFLMAN